MNYPLISYFHNSSHHCRSGLLGLMVLLTGLLSGCASEPPLSSSVLDRDVYRHNAYYNKPYKVHGKTYYPMARQQQVTANEALLHGTAPNPAIKPLWEPASDLKGSRPLIKPYPYRVK